MSTTDEPESSVDEIELAAVDIEPVAAEPPGSRDWRVRLAAFAAYAAVFGVAAGLGWPLWQQHQLATAVADGRQAAAEFAQTLTSVDSDNVDLGFDAVLNGATGELKDSYTKASGELRQLLIDNRATAKGEVVAAAVQSESKNRVVVLVAVDQTVTNTARPDPRVDRNRMKMTMEKVDGRWLASKVELP